MNKRKNPLKTCFFTGLISILPIVLTIKIFQVIFEFIFNIVSKSSTAKLVHMWLVSVSKNLGINSSWLELHGLLLTFLTIIMTISAITLLGFTLRHVFVEKVLGLVKKVMAKLPLVNTIYNAVTQLLEMVSGDKAETYKKAVLLEYPRKGIYSVGFLTSESNELFENVLGVERMYNIFIPTSPNPTSGLFISVPQSEVTILDIKVDEAIKLIISGGAIVPPYIKKTEE